MIHLARGDILQATVDALVNPVNTVGVMGAGLALQFKQAYPAMFAEYESRCWHGHVRLGTMDIHLINAGRQRPRYIINFPTKGHWRDQSELDDIERGLEDLAYVIQACTITSIAVPPLGCGLGGLSWVAVEEAIRHYLGDLPDVNVVLYLPVAPSSPERWFGS